MKLFVDSANLEEIKEAVSWGVVEGATTNPSLMAKEKGVKFEVLAKKICRLVAGPVSLEGGSLETKAMIKEGRKLAKIAKNVVVKIPMTIEGMQAVKVLAKEKIKTNVTLIFSVNQALVAAKMGASYVSPFLGRLDDMGQSGVDLLAEIMAVYGNYGFKTEVIAASIRHADHVKQSAMLGSDIATIPFGVLKKLYGHALTDKGIEAFTRDWKSLKS